MARSFYTSLTENLTIPADQTNPTFTLGWRKSIVEAFGRLRREIRKDVDDSWGYYYPVGIYVTSDTDPTDLGFPGTWASQGGSPEVWKRTA